REACMSGIVETIQAIVRHELARVRVADLGVVETVRSHAAGGDHDNYGCDVRLKNSGLLLKRVPIATQHVGSVAAPAVGDLVLLTYDKGDVNQPVLIGRLYSDSARPPVNETGEILTRLPLGEDDDATLVSLLRNVGGEREARLELAPKVTVLADKGSIQATAGKNELLIEQPGGSGGTVKITAGRTTITLKQDGDVTVEAAGNLTLKANGDLTLEGTNVKVKAKANGSVEANAQLTLKGSVAATVQGGASATLQGGMVTVKGMTTFSM
ncbi:MAG: phage baseplate assembly protein V, partial [Longimicrobiaceae bacterium]